MAKWLNSQPLELAALRGKVVLLEFWNIGTPFRRELVPALRQIYATYHPAGLEMIAVHAPTDGPGRAGSELLAYTRAMALLVIGATTMVVAGFCALPAVRRRPGLAAPVAAFVAAVFLIGPGAQAINGGIANFAVACCLVVAAVLLAATAARVFTPLTLAALGGAVVGIATGWVLLLVLALPAILMLVFPLRRRRWWASEARMASSAVLVLVVIGCLARTAAVLSRVQAPSPLTIDGGRVPVDVGLLVAATLAIVGACLLLLRAPRRGVRTRIAAMLAMPVVGVATAGALVALQVQANGEVTYYGFKFLLGMEIVLLAALAVPLVHLCPLPQRPRPRRSAVSGAAASLLVAAALTQVFGLAVADLGGIGLGVEAQGAKDAAHQEQLIADPPSAADLVTRVAAMDGQVPRGGAYYLDIGSDGRVSSVLVAQWFLAFTDTWTLDANTVASGTVLNRPGGPGPVAEDILRSHPGSVVVVRWEDVDTLRQDIRQPDMAYRIVGL